MVKNVPANAGDTGSSPGLGRSHMPRALKLLSLCSTAHEPQLLSPRAATTEACELQLLKPTHLEPMIRNKRSHHNEKPAHRNEE